MRKDRDASLMEGHHTTAGASAEVLDRPVAECAADSERQFVRRRQSRASEALHGSWALPNRDSLPPTVGSAPGPLRRPWARRRIGPHGRSQASPSAASNWWRIWFSSCVDGPVSITGGDSVERPKGRSRSSTRRFQSKHNAHFNGRARLAASDSLPAESVTRRIMDRPDQRNLTTDEEATVLKRWRQSE